MKKSELGVGLILAGIGLLFSQQISSITGFAINQLDSITVNWIKIFGAVLTASGTFLFVGGLENEVEKNHLELQRLGAVYKSMEKKGVPGAYSPETVGKTIANREIFGLLKDTRDYVHSSFPDSETEVVLAGSISKSKGGKRTEINRVWTKETGMPKESFDPEKQGIPSDLHYISDLDLAIINPQLFDYVIANWPEARALKKYHGDHATVNIDTSHLLYGKPEPASWKTMPKDVRNYIETIAKREYAGRTRPVELKFMKDREDLAGIGKFDCYKIKGKR